jgi:hypothetical protein
MSGRPGDRLTDFVNLLPVFEELTNHASLYTLKTWAREKRIPKVVWYQAQPWCQESDVERVREYLLDELTSEKFRAASARARASAAIRAERRRDQSPPPSQATQFDVSAETLKTLNGIYELCRAIQQDVRVLRGILPELQALRECWE